MVDGDIYARATLEVDTSQATESVRALNRELEKMKDAGTRAGGVPRPTPATTPHLYPWQTRVPTGPKASEWVAQQLGLPPERELPRATAAQATAAGLAPWQTRIPTGPRAAEWVAQQGAAAPNAAQAAAEELSKGVTDTLNAKGPTVKQQLLNFVNSIKQSAASGLAALGKAIAQAAVVTTLVAPLLAFAAGLKVLKTSFEWAQEAADNQIKTAGRTRRLYPQLVGEGLEAAEEEMRTRMGVASALFGGAADSMQEQFTKRTSEYRLGRGLRGDRDIFARWGITPEGIRTAEIVAGKRLDVTDWLQGFVLKREELERLLAQAKTPEEKVGLQRRMAQLMDDAAKIGGTKFADMVGVLTREDIPQLTKNIEKAAPLGHVEQYSRKSVDFWISFGSLQGTFKALKEGITADVQPSITKFLDALNQKLIGTKEGGEGLGMMFRQLASTMANKAWEALQVIMEKLTPQRVTGWIEIVTSWSPKETADKIVLFFNAFMAIAKALWRVIEAIGGFMEKLPEDVGGRAKKIEAEKAGREAKPGVVTPGGAAPGQLSPEMAGGGITPTTTAAGATFAPPTPTTAQGGPGAAPAAPPSGVGAANAVASAMAAGGGTPAGAGAAGGGVVGGGVAPIPAQPAATAPGGVAPPTAAAAPAGLPATTAQPAAAAGPLIPPLATQPATGPPVAMPPTQPAAQPFGLGGWQPPTQPAAPTLPAGLGGEEKGLGAIFEQQAAKAATAVQPQATAADAIKATSAGAAAMQISSTIEQRPSGSMLAMRISPEVPTPSVLRQRQAAGFYQPPTPLSTLSGQPSRRGFYNAWTDARDFFDLGSPPLGRQEKGWGTLFEEQRAAPGGKGGGFFTREAGLAWGQGAGEGIASQVAGLSIQAGYAPTSYGVTTVPKNTGGDTPTEG